MENYKLIACDLDGTLVSSDLSISEDNKKAISEFKKMGVHFVPCTGRTLSEMQEVVQNPDIRYIIYSNGAAILDKETNTTTFLGFSKQQACVLMQLLLGFDCFIILHFQGESFVDIKPCEEIFDKYNLHFNVRQLIGCFANVVGSLCDIAKTREGIECITVFFRNDEDKQRCARLLSENGTYSFVNGWNLNLEIFRSDTSKGNALVKISEMLGVDINETITIGDSDNDKSMTEASGLGLAVSNAAEALKKVADEIICSNDESVADFVLKKYFG